MANKFSGKVAIISGSSRGIGKAIAIELAKNGASIVVNGRNKEQLNIAKKEIEVYTKNVISVCCDVSIIAEGKYLISAALDAFGHLDILINNAGISMRGGMNDLNPEVFPVVFRTNVFGTVNLIIPAIPEIRKTQGSIIFVSSVAGIRGLPFLSAYCSSKMALKAIAESIRIEEYDNNIHVGLIYVGKTEIDSNKEIISHDGSKKVLMERIKENVLSKEYVAKAILKNIRKRKFTTTLSTIGKLNKLLQPHMPMIIEKIISRNLRKFEKGNQ